MTSKRIAPGPGQESVCDYPRPPKLDLSSRHVRVLLAGQTIADTSNAFRVLETSHPPTWYIPRQDIQSEYLRPTAKGSHCEWKGQASYWSVQANGRLEENAAWSYEHPSPAFTAIEGHVAFYPSRFKCYVDNELVTSQPGDFYGGWITTDVVGPFKGAPGTWGW